MATVYRARDLDTGKDVALKLLHERDPISRERFNQEAALLAELSHPAIVRYVAHGTTSEGDPFLAMEWLDGETLEDRLARGPLSVLDVARLGRHVLDALAMAHRHGVIHRDIKPANLYLPRGELSAVKLLDFGIARRMFESKRMTQVGAALGTPMYMSPEQARGERDIDARADLFSLGCVLYEGLTGAPPFIGETAAAVLAKICLTESPRVASAVPGVPPALERVIDTMLAKDREQRAARASDLSEELSLLIDELSQRSQQAGGGGDDLRRTQPLPAVGEQRVVSVVMVARARTRATSAPALRTWQGGVEGAPSTDVFDEDQFGKVRAAVAAVGGRLDRLLDGTVVVTLSGRGAPTDQAAQAARCALSLRDLLPFAAVAVSTGRAVLGSELPIGNVLDGAARLLAAASEGAVVVDQITADLVEARFQIREQEPRLLLFEKGLKEAPRTLLGRETPCVGRDRELGTLLGIYEECVADPGARVVLVTAPPGAGKSRVRHELFERVQRLGQPFEFLIGQGDALRTGAPYALIGLAVRTAAGITGTEPEIVQQKRLVAHVTRFLPADKAASVAAFLGEICGIHFSDADAPALAAARKDPRLMSDRTQGAWLDFIDAVTADRPLLLVLEDLHWGDQPSVQLVDAALRRHRERPFMVLAFARPEVDEAFSGLWAERDLQRVSLAPLTSKACSRLVRAVLSELPEERAAWLVERCDGNPFMLEELLRAAAAGALAGDGAALPESVIGMVQARFDAVGPEAKRILRAASIYGQTFRRGGVAALLASDESAGLDAWLEVLAAREVIFPRSAGQTQEFVFRHALLRDAAYDLLPVEARMAGHRSAGAWLEESGEREAIVLVEHYERGGDAAKAAHFCRYAAAQALDAANPTAAIERAVRGVRHGAQGETLGYLCLYESKARFLCGEFANAETAARRARKCLHGDARLAATDGLIAALGQQAEFDEVAFLLEEIGDTLDEGASPERIGCVLRAGDYLMVGGSYKVAERALVRVEAHEATLEPALRARANDLRAKLACHAGDTGAGADGFAVAKELYESLGDERSAHEELQNLGTVLGELGLFEEAESALRRALAAGQRLNDEGLAAMAELNLIQVLTRRGKLREAREMGERALEAAERRGDPRVQGGAALFLSAALCGEGRFVEAELLARAAVALFDAVPSALPWALAELARVHLVEGRVAEALAGAEKAVEKLEAVGRVEDGEGVIRLVYAEALAAAGQASAAKAARARAVSRLNERAAAIGKAEWRRSFLENVPDHARTFALVAADDVPG